MRATMRTVLGAVNNAYAGRTLVDLAAACRLRRPVSPAGAGSDLQYILMDMYAKAVQGIGPSDAVKWAHGELVKIDA
jgi:hypothetical protein